MYYMWYREMPFLLAFIEFVLNLRIFLFGAYISLLLSSFSSYLTFSCPSLSPLSPLSPSLSLSSSLSLSLSRPPSLSLSLSLSLSNVCNYFKYWYYFRRFKVLRIRGKDSSDDMLIEGERCQRRLGMYPPTFVTASLINYYLFTYWFAILTMIWIPV